MFKKESALVKIWVGIVMAGTYKLEEVPQLSNLREVVSQVIKEMAQ